MASANKIRTSLVAIVIAPMLCLATSSTAFADELSKETIDLTECSFTYLYVAGSLNKSDAKKNKTIIDQHLSKSALLMTAAIMANLGNLQPALKLFNEGYYELKKKYDQGNSNPLSDVANCAGNVIPIANVVRKNNGYMDTKGFDEQTKKAFQKLSSKLSTFP